MLNSNPNYPKPKLRHSNAKNIPPNLAASYRYEILMGLRASRALTKKEEQPQINQRECANEATETGLIKRFRSQNETGFVER